MQLPLAVRQRSRPLTIRLAASPPRRLAASPPEVTELIGVQARLATVAALGAASLTTFAAELRARRIDPATVGRKGPRP